jgi:hypothetical protein
VVFREIKRFVSCYGPGEMMIVQRDGGSLSLFYGKHLSWVRDLDRLGTGISWVLWNADKQLLVAYPRDGDRMLVWSAEGAFVATPKSLKAPPGHPLPSKIGRTRFTL